METLVPTLSPGDGLRIVTDGATLTLASVPANGDASFGAALVAGLGVGVFSSPEEAVERCVRLVARHRPDPECHALYSELFDVYKDAQARLAPIDHRLHALTTR